MNNRKVIIITRKGIFYTLVEMETHLGMYKLSDNDSGIYQVRIKDMHKILNTSNYNKEYIVTNEDNFDTALYRWKKRFTRIKEEAQRQIDLVDNQESIIKKGSI